MSLQSVASAAAIATNRDCAVQAGHTANTLSHYFPDYFQALQANTEPLKRATYRLRHQVYCEELQFEPERADALEHDHFDDRAMHIAVKHLLNDSLAGTVRIVTSQFKNEPLPIEQYYSGDFTNTVLAPANFSRQHICEISRLAVPAAIRCRAPGQDAASLERSCSKLVAISLYLLAQILCLRAGRVHTYVMIEPALARALRRVGLHFVQIGQPIVFNGIRAPYYLDARTTNTSLSPEYLQLRALLEQQLFANSHSSRPQMTLCYSAP
ncbi:MAG TPA: PEP-CTERM/exosortase system-associated acyltransferase [Rheinheimera sp.]|nr:PEP-CTERM/exosortase system-associated acyltransferase [Rheinheimera sp.]